MTAPRCAPTIDADPVLDPAIYEWGKTGAGDFPPDMSVAEAREKMDSLVKDTSPPIPESIVRSEFFIDTSLKNDNKNGDGKVLIVLYKPKKSESESAQYERESERVPVLVYFHGGGYVVGSPITHETLCWKLAEASGAAVMFVHYTRSPEVHYPVANEECYESFQWVQKRGSEHGLDGEKVTLVGDSVGGNLVTAVTLLSLHRNTPLPRSQILLYPVLDFANESWSYRLWPRMFGLTARFMRTAISLYAPDYRQRVEPQMSNVLIADGDLERFPETVVVIAEADVLRGEGEVFGRRLLRAGVKAFVSMTYGGTHDYTTYPKLAGTGAYCGTIDLIAGHARRNLFA